MGSIRLLVMKSAPRFDPPVTHKNGHVSNTHIYFALSHFCRPFCTYSSHFFTSMASDVSERLVTENFGGNLRTFWTKLRKHLADNTFPLNPEPGTQQLDTCTLSRLYN